MFFSVTTFLLFAYVSLRLIVPLPIGMAAKTGASLFVLLVSLKHYFFRHFFGGLASPELPRLVIIITGWIYVTLVLVFVFLVARDVLFILLFAARKAGFLTGLHVTYVQTALGILFLSFILSTWGLYEAVRLASVKKTEAVFKNLPQELDGLSIVQLTDTHASTFHPEPNIRNMVEATNQLNPDIIVLTGDIVDGSPVRRAKDVAPLADLRARYGVFGAAGNHEYFSGFDDWRNKFDELGIPMLYNRHTVLTIKDQRLVIAGITDPVAQRFGKEPPDILQALEGAPEGVFRILLAHRPAGAKIHAAAGIDLQLSGHTHGGQIFGLNLIVAHFNENFLKGWYDVDGMKLHISTGVTLWNGFPVRLGAPSEISYIVLRSAK